MNHSRLSHRGSALLISIIITSSLLIVGVEVSMFVISSIRQARTIDHALSATYAAESGVESALHQIRKEGLTILRADSISSPPLYTVDARDASWTFKKGDALDPEKFNTTITTLTKGYLGEQEGVDIHLYTSDDLGFVPATQKIVNGVTYQMQDMVISWKSSSCAEAGDIPQVEITAISWPLNTKSIQQWSAGATIVKDFKTPTSDSPQTVTAPIADLIPNQPLSSTGLTVRIKPFFCSLRNVSISFFGTDENGSRILMPIPHYYSLAPVGSFGSVQKTLQVQATEKSGASGVFDFTLFSDERVDKKDE